MMKKLILAIVFFILLLYLELKYKVMEKVNMYLMEKFFGNWRG